MHNTGEVRQGAPAYLGKVGLEQAGDRDSSMPPESLSCILCSSATNWERGAGCGYREDAAVPGSGPAVSTATSIIQPSPGRCGIPLGAS